MIVNNRDIFVYRIDECFLQLKSAILFQLKNTIQFSSVLSEKTISERSCRGDDWNEGKTRNCTELSC